MTHEKFAKDVGLIGTTRVLLMGLSGFILMPLLTKNLSAHDYGLWVQVIVTMTLFQGLIFLGLTHAMTRFLAGEKNKERIREGFYSIIFFVLFTSLVVSFFLVAFPDKLANNFFDGAVDIVKITGLIIILHVLAWSCQTFFRTFSKMKIYSFFAILENIGLITLIYFSLFLGYGIIGVVISLLIIKVIMFSIPFSMIISKIGFKFPNFSQLKRYLQFSLPIVPSNISNWVITSVDRYLIGYFIGTTFVGYYNSGYLLGSLATIFSGVLIFVLMPSLSKLYEEGKVNEVKSYLSYSVKYFLMISIPFFFATILLSKPILNILTTQEIASAGSIVSPFIALGAIFQGISFIIMQALILTKDTKIIGLAWIISAVINFSLNVLLIPNFGILGAAFAMSICYVPLMIIFASKSLKFKIDTGFIVKSTTASLLMCLPILGLNLIGRGNLLIAISISVIIYFGALFSMKGFSKEEIIFLRNLI